LTQSITPGLTQSSNILDIRTGNKKALSLLLLLLYLEEKKHVPIEEKAVELI
jgi:hypothetical protein